MSDNKNIEDIYMATGTQAHSVLLNRTGSDIPATLMEAEELAAMYFVITGQMPVNKEGRRAVEECKARLAMGEGI